MYSDVVSHLKLPLVSENLAVSVTHVNAKLPLVLAKSGSLCDPC